MKRKVLVIILAILVLASLTACGEEEQVLTNQKGEAIEYTLGEIESSGFYVHNKKTDTFRPLMTGASGYQGLANEHDPSRFIWFGSKDHNLVNLIPPVDNKTTELVIIESRADSMPSSYVLEKYKNLGYTIGANFTFAETGDQLYISKEAPCDTSMANEELSNLTGNLTPVHKINDNADLPFDNVDTDVMMLLGLEKDKKYKVSVFDGTAYKELTFIADTIAFKSQKLIELSSPYKTTENNYFIINLPTNLEKGYYYINDFGLFKYTADTASKPVTKKDTKKEDETTAPTEAVESQPAAETPTTSVE